jgi:hypothetical protein
MSKDKDRTNTYIVFNEDYLGPGYFLIEENSDNIVRFAKFYQMDRTGFPRYGIRAYEVGSVDQPNQDFRDIVFKINRDDNLFDLALRFASKTKKEKLVSIDSANQGSNSFSAEIVNNQQIDLIFSKDVYGVRNATDFIDIVLGDNVTCKKYLELCSLLCDFGEQSIKPHIDINIQKMLKL